MLPLLLALACAGPPSAPPPQLAWTRPEYFHLDDLHADPAVARYRQDWYARTLAALAEPSFLELARRPGQAYRFLWLRHWHGPVSVRISRVGDLAVAEARTLHGRARVDETGDLRAVRRVVLTGDQWQGLQARVDAAGFWQAPSQDPHEDGTVEGARWVFEGIDDGRQHTMDRWSPDDPALVELGLHMLGLAGIEIPPREVY